MDKKIPYNVDEKFIRSYDRRSNALMMSMVAGFAGLVGLVAGGISEHTTVASISGGITVLSAVPIVALIGGLKRDAQKYQVELKNAVYNEIYGGQR